MKKSERVTTSIKIDPEKWKKAKIEAIKHGIELSELIDEAIDIWISKKK